MRPICLLLLSAAAVCAQPIGFGIKGGLPMNDFVDAASNQSFRFDTTTNRYIIGPMVELRLPFGLGIELDALYRHFGYSSFSSTSGITTTITDARTSSSAWEFPLVGKYKFKGVPLLRPYVEAGVSWNKFSGLTQSITKTVANITNTTTTSNPAELRNDTARGFVLGAGLDIKALVIHVTPGLRYTRWGSDQISDSTGLLNSNRNQAEFLIGISF
jgi:opacity protein-like surface antigen